MNRGRIQAQGGGTEKSAAWTTLGNFTKAMGIERVDNLETQLTPAELRLRTTALIKSRNRIINSPLVGLSAISKKSYYDDFRNRDIRVDVEVLGGVCFIDEPLIEQQYGKKDLV